MKCTRTVLNGARNILLLPLLFACDPEPPLAPTGPFDPGFAKGGKQTVTADLSMSGALSAAASPVPVTQDNPQILQLAPGGYAVHVNLPVTHAHAAAEWAAHDDANECTIELPPGNYDRNAVVQTLLGPLVSGDTFFDDGIVQFDKQAVAAGAESADSYISGAGVTIGRSNGAQYYGFLLVTSADDVNDAAATRVFEIAAGHGTVRTLTRVGTKPKDPVANLRCRLRDAITVTVGPSS